MTTQTETIPKPIKPLGHRAYGSIPHLIGSRRGPSDIGVNDGQHRICTEKARDKFDRIIVQEKLDGTCVSVAKINGQIVPLIRAGYPAIGSNYRQHHLFHDWAVRNEPRFASLLKEGERVVGEWLAQAHGTRYKLPHEPFVAFDIMRGHERTLFDDLASRCAHEFVLPKLINNGPPISIETVLRILEPSGHGAIDPVEGAVWRVERPNDVDFLAKYVRPEKIDGCFLDKDGQPPLWNEYPPSISQ